jgi:hypothetical protein
MLDALIAEIEAPPPMKFVAVTALAVKFPEASRATIVLAPLAEAAVVAELGMLVNEAPEPLKVVAVITFPAKEPAALRETIVDAPLASEAVVRALAIVPLDIFEALIAVKEEALPEIFVKVPVVPVITFPAKEPLASRTTRVEAPLAEVALVLALSKVPVVIAEALIAVMAEPLPEKDAPVIAPAANSPEAPRRTIVEAPLAVAAVVLAFAIVPEAMLEALIFEPPDRSPITAAVIVAATKLPPESRWTIVEAPLELDAVVRAFAMVPEEMLEALIADSVAPLPLNVAVTIFAPKLPLASLATIVEALFASEAVVLALASVPELIFDALIAVRATPLPDTLVNEPVVPLKVVALDVVAVMTLPAKDPLESRNTIVLAPLAEAAVVLPLAKVPTEILEALIETLAALVS